MAFALKYYSYFDSYDQKVAAKIEIHVEGFTGTSAEIKYNAVDACSIKYNGGMDNLKDVLFGSELIHNFYVTPSDNDKYDSLLETDYKDVLIKYFEGTTQKWAGYLNQEKTSRQVYENNYLIKLSAADGIAALKNEDFVNVLGHPYEDRVSILTVIRRCMDKRGAAMAMDYRIQVGTYEKNIGSSTTLAFSHVTIDCRRFINEVAGVKKSDNCYRVLNRVLQPFNVILRQSEMKIWIRQKLEMNSYVYAYQSDGTYVSRTANNLLKNIDNYKFLKSANQLVKYRPFDRAWIKFINRRIISNLVANSDFSNGTTNWNNGISPADWYQFTTSGGHLVCTEPPLGDPSDEKYFESDIFSVTYSNTGDKLRVEVEAEVSFVDFDTGSVEERNPVLEIALVLPSGSVVRGDHWVMDTYKKKYIYEFSITTTGNHKVRIYNREDTYTDIESYSIIYHLIEAFAIYEEDDFTFDRMLKVINSSPMAKKDVEMTVYFGDSTQNDDVGALKIGTAVTELWNSYGGSEGVPIIELLAKQLLQDRGKWKNILLLGIYNLSADIYPHQVMQLDSREYDFVSFDRDVVRNTIKCQLIEIVDSSITYDKYWQIMTSIDGV